MPQTVYRDRNETATGPVLPLNRMAAGERGAVRDVVGRPDQIQRLKELGFGRGETIEVVQSGSPCIIRIGTRKLCFRAAEVLGVLVQVGAVS